MKPLWLAIVLIAAIAQHYMLTYRVVMGPTTMANALQTDFHETRDLLSWRMVFNVALVVVPAAWWLVCVRIRPMPVWGAVPPDLVEQMITKSCVDLPERYLLAFVYC